MKVRVPRLAVAVTALLVMVALGVCLIGPDCDDGPPHELCAGTVAVTVFVGALTISLLTVGRLTPAVGIRPILVPIFVLEPPPKSALLA